MLQHLIGRSPVQTAVHIVLIMVILKMRCLCAKLFERTEALRMEKGLVKRTLEAFDLPVSPGFPLGDEQGLNFHQQTEPENQPQGMGPAVASLKDNSLSNWRKSGIPNFFQVRIKPSATLSSSLRREGLRLILCVAISIMFKL